MRASVDAINDLLFNCEYEIRITDLHYSDGEIIFELEGNGLPDQCDDNGNDRISLSVLKEIDTQNPTYYKKTHNIRYVENRQ